MKSVSCKADVDGGDREATGRKWSRFCTNPLLRHIGPYRKHRRKVFNSRDQKSAQTLHEAQILKQGRSAFELTYGMGIVS